MKKLAALILSVSAIAQVATPLVVNPGSGTETGEIRLRERRSNGSNYVGLRSPSATSTDLVWDLPASDGTLGQALVTNGAGVLSWSSVAGTSFPVCTSTTGNDTYVCTVAGFTAYSAGYCIILQADTANTGTATVNISAVGAKSILRYGGSALSNNDILANTPVMICYDGTQFQLPPSASPGSGSFLDGGNSFGATATLGTNDNYDLNIERNNTTLINVGASGINMAPSGTANFYNKVRKLEITGISGETAFWDIQTAANMASSSNFKLRDNAGSRAILIDRAIAGSPLNNIGLFGNVIPRKRAIADGDAVDDTPFPDLGASASRWANIYGGALDLSGAANITGNLSAAVINATGSPAYRVSGTTVIDASRNATFVGLTIPTGAVNNYVWTGNGSGVGSWQATQACATCIVNGGNSFGAAATIGTNDANILNFETDNAARWRITAVGMLQPAADDTYDIGDLSSARVRGVYAKYLETSESGGTGDYVKSRLFRVVDAAGGAGYWDLTANAAAGLSNIGIKDNSGSRLMVGWRANGSAVNYTRWYSALLPAKRDTLDGDAATDLLFPELGSSTARWSTAYIGGLDIDGSVVGDLVPITTSTYDLGESAVRWRKLWSGSGDISGTLTVGTATNTVALTASGATYLQTTGIGEASPAKGLLSVYGHNGYAYTPYNIVASARFRTGANSAILFGTTIPNTSGWTRGMYWSYLTEDWTLSRFKDDESAVPINDLYVAADGRVGIGTAAVTEELTVNGSIDVIGSGAIEVAGTTVIDASRNATVANLTITGSCTGCPGGLPAVDTTSIVTGSSDTSKQLRFEVDGFTTATTRILTPQNASYTLAGTDLAQTFTAAQTFNNTVNLNNGFSTDGNVILTSTRILSNVTGIQQSLEPTSNNLYNLGSTSLRWANVNAVGLNFSSGGTIGGDLVLSGSTNTMSGTLRPGFDALGSIGSSSFKYGAVYAYDVVAASNLWVSSSVVINSSRNLVGLNAVNQTLLFTPDNSYDIGSSGASRPRNIYAAGVGTFGGAVTGASFNTASGGGYSVNGTLVISSGRELGNITYVSVDLIPNLTTTYSLGSSVYKWNKLWVQDVDAATGTFSGNVVMSGSTNTMSGTMRPGFDGIGSIGTSSYRYGDLYSYNANFAGTITAPSGSTGWSGTRTVRDSAGTGTCTLIFSGGILTGGTC